MNTEDATEANTSYWEEPTSSNHGPYTARRRLWPYNPDDHRIDCSCGLCTKFSKLKDYQRWLCEYKHYNGEKEYES